jgi:shikimate kinase
LNGDILKIILIGCEYTGKSTLAMKLVQWGKTHDIQFHLDDHFTIPDASLPDEDRKTMLNLSPQFKERFQRFQDVYHVRILRKYRDAIEVGFYSENTIYGPLYYGYQPNFLAIRHGRRLEKELPDETILVLLTAIPSEIIKRMTNHPHAYQIIKQKDIPELLAKFEEEYQSTTIHAKIKIDTTNLTPDQVLQELLSKARCFLPLDDLIRMMR